MDPLVLERNEKRMGSPRGGRDDIPDSSCKVTIGLCDLPLLLFDRIDALEDGRGGLKGEEKYDIAGGGRERGPRRYPLVEVAAKVGERAMMIAASDLSNCNCKEGRGRRDGRDVMQ